MARMEQNALNEYMGRLIELSRLLEGDYGFKIEKTGGSIGINSADVSFHITPTDDEKVDPLDTAHARQFTRMAELVGLKPDDLGRTFKHGNGTYTLIGYDVTRARPFIVLDAHGIIREGNEAIIPSVEAARLAS